MARKKLLDQDDLYIVATYFAQPEVQTEIHAEIPKRRQSEFENDYHTITGLDLPNIIGREPYYVWPEGTNKQGIQLRIYFNPISPIPPQVDDLRSNSTWVAKKNKHRINHTNLVIQLFKCGFVLGSNTKNSERITNMMNSKFPNTKS